MWLGVVSLVVVGGLRAKVTIAKVANAGYNIKLTINLRVQSGSNNFHLLINDTFNMTP